MAHKHAKSRSLFHILQRDCPLFSLSPKIWDIEMMSETKFYSYAEYEQNKWYGVIKSV